MIEETVEVATEAATPAPVAPAAAPQAGQRQRGQGGQRGGFGGGQNSEQYVAMVTSLGLNAEQKVQFDAINSSYISKMMKKREEARASGSFEGMRDDMRKMRDDQKRGHQKSSNRRTVRHLFCFFGKTKIRKRQ